MIPQYTKNAIDKWVSKGIRPGSFVEAVLSNDLMGAFAKADDTNMYYMLDIIRYVYNEIPADCQGSKEKFKAWPELLASRVERGISYDDWNHE